MSGERHLHRVQQALVEFAAVNQAFRRAANAHAYSWVIVRGYNYQVYTLL